MALLVRFSLDGLLGDQIPFIVFLIVVTAAAWVAGLGPALLVMALGFLAGDYYFVTPRHTLPITGQAHLLEAISYFALGLPIAFFSHAIHVARRNAIARQRDLQREVDARQEAEEAVRRSEGQLRQLVDMIPQIAWTAGPDGRTDYLNDRARLYEGLRRFENGSWEWASSLHPDDRERVTRLWNSRYQAGEVYEAEFRLRLVGETAWRWHLGRAVPLRDQRGDIVKWFGTITDIEETRRVQDSQRQNEQRLQMAMLIGRSFAFEWDPATDKVLRSDSCGPILGVHGDAVQHDTSGGYFRRIHPEDRERFIQTTRSLRPGQDSYRIQYRLTREDGGTVVLEEIGQASFDAEGHLVRLMGIATDVTERQFAEEALRQSERQLRLFIEGAPAAIAMMDTQVRYLVASRRWMTDYGLEGRDLRGLSHYDVFPEIPQRWKDIHQRCLAGAVESAAEDPFVRADGTVQWLRWEVGPWRTSEGAVGGLIMFSEDITARKLAEEALRQAKDHLELRVHERTAELSQTVQTLELEVNRRTQAEQALRRRTEQLRALASQLTLTEQRERQRLAQVLHDGLQQLLVGAKFRLELLGRAGDENVRHLAAKVGDLLSDSIETSRSLTADLSPPILREGGLARALEWLAFWMHDKHGLTVRLHLHGGAEPGSPDTSILLFQAARELLFNVAKHAGVKEAEVELSRQDDRVRVTISDRGAGFDPATLGTRGGLFTIRERLDLLGGQMEIDSRPGQGSRFTLTAPMFAPPEAAVPAPGAMVPPAAGVYLPAPPAGNGRTRIVLVDDHAVLRQGLAALLREQPDLSVVAEASDGPSALEVVRQTVPDVVLMDISLPGMSGIELTRIIHSELPTVQVIGLSMFSQAEQSEAMFEAGASAYVAKSDASSTLIQTIRTCVSQHQPE